MLRYHRQLIAALLVAAVALAFVGERRIGTTPPLLHDAFGRGPTIVLIHGLGSSAQHWLPTARILARRHRVVLVDLPGHGESGMPRPFTLEAAIEALDQALADEGDHPVVLVGHSLGGLVAAGETIEHPGRVRGLVLVETALRPQVDAAERAAMLDRLDHDYDGLLHDAYLSFGRDSAQGEGLYREAAAMDPATVKPWIRLALTADLSRRAAAIVPPVLAVLSERSWPRTEEWSVTARDLGLERVPHLDRARVADSGHFVMLDHPAEVARLIERFADSPEASPIAMR